MRFTKGHGTGNDFVVIPDPEGALEVTPTLVRALCHRRLGVGGDGVLRVVRTERAAQAPDIDVVAAPGGPDWFMDYRNADGSLAQMCGNGIRVFARYLVDRGLADPGRQYIGTRGGVRVVDVPEAGDITVDMGAPVLAGFPEAAQVGLAGVRYPARGLGMPNPHAVVMLPTLDGLPAALPAPDLDAADFPEGANVEFIAPLPRGSHGIRMRVYERGAAETLSCGTGACAAAVVASSLLPDLDGGPIRVEVPGGVLHVAFTPGGSVTMTGPAALVADGTIRPQWLAEHS
ncbi:MAG: Diaminopimelate epimerase [Actinomycetota bacterium]|nr:Diaminopimelate epimerase [Actinomycetota bacterium]